MKTLFLLAFGVLAFRPVFGCETPPKTFAFNKIHYQLELENFKQTYSIEAILPDLSAACWSKSKDGSFSTHFAHAELELWASGWNTTRLLDSTSITELQITYDEASGNFHLITPPTLKYNTIFDIIFDSKANSVGVVNQRLPLFLNHTRILEITLL